MCYETMEIIEYQVVKHKSILFDVILNTIQRHKILLLITIT